MKVYNNLQNFVPLKNAVVTTGTFDGVHLGHLKIISRLRELAQNSGGETVIISFFPHPRMVLFPDDTDLKLLNTQQEKIHLIENQKIDNLIILPFTKEFSRLTSLEFVRNILVNQIGVKKLVIGYDHHFGRNREGSFEHLKEFGPLYGFDVEEIPKKDIEQVAVSSTKIRAALQSGDLRTANAFLNYHYSLEGLVVKGHQLGRTINFPTANIKVEDELKYKLIPADGVYAVQVLIESKVFGGMMNIGFRPTVDGNSRSIEVHIFNFDADIYNTRIRVFFVEKIRDEKKFASVDELKNQLLQDKIFAENLLHNLPQIVY